MAGAVEAGPFLEVHAFEAVSNGRWNCWRETVQLQRAGQEALNAVLEGVAEEQQALLRQASAQSSSSERGAPGADGGPSSLSNAPPAPSIPNVPATTSTPTPPPPPPPPPPPTTTTSAPGDTQSPENAPPLIFPSFKVADAATYVEHLVLQAPIAKALFSRDLALLREQRIRSRRAKNRARERLYRTVTMGDPQMLVLEGNAHIGNMRGTRPSSGSNDRAFLRDRHGDRWLTTDEFRTTMVPPRLLRRRPTS